MEYFEKERNLNSTADKPKIQKLKRRCQFLQSSPTIAGKLNTYEVPKVDALSSYKIRNYLCVTEYDHTSSQKVMESEISRNVFISLNS